MDRDAYRVIKKSSFMVPLGDVAEEVNTLQIKTNKVTIISSQILGSLRILLSVKELRKVDFILRKQQYVSVLSFLCILLLLCAPWC